MIAIISGITILISIVVLFVVKRKNMLIFAVNWKRGGAA